MNTVDIFIIVKDEGSLIHKYSILGLDEGPKDQLMSGFLTALNNFAHEIGWPSGVSLVRSGSLEARFSSGKKIFSVLIIDYSRPLGANTEPILSGLAKEITLRFEEKYKDKLKSDYYNSTDFNDFTHVIDEIINRYGAETMELYQKLILIESMYAKVPQKWCLPLIERVSKGENVLGEFPKIIKKYRNMKKAIKKVNANNAPVWEIFAIPTYRVK